MTHSRRDANPDLATPDLSSLSVLAEAAIANGWPAADVADVLTQIVGPSDGPVVASAPPVQASRSSQTVRSLFGGAAKTR
ncbi:hypothetical protein ASG43_02710 [Aureimonas sp. Leaf454]|uniref:hypothetical protein n=1 Tax=Aureimonas sp. Leaf454 TaxID=1736381 RepID=UPI0006FB57D8|nr:hypothetical protein [Aureimonas sp. Leaf454]KQT54522.1 hypothetical protein ASG43_02710 [Aureimonas sp. Leaf454]